MNKKSRVTVILVVILSLIFSQVAFAKTRGSGGKSGKRGRKSGSVSVRGYYRKDGTYVRSHTRSYPSTHSYAGHDYTNNSSFFISEDEKNQLSSREKSLDQERKKVYAEINELQNEIEELKRENEQVKNVGDSSEFKDYTKDIFILDENFNIEKCYLDNKISSTDRKYKDLWEIDLNFIQDGINRAKESILSKKKKLRKVRENINKKKKKYGEIQENVLRDRRTKEYLAKIRKEYINFIDLNAINIEQEIKVTFSKRIDINTINDKTIMLISEKTSEHIPLTFSMLKPNKVRIVPKQPLDHNEVYYLVINNSVKAEDGSNIVRGVICKTIKN
ncbi:Ig-like domain-containing protein [Clostridium novyi]